MCFACALEFESPKDTLEESDDAPPPRRTRTPRRGRHGVDVSQSAEIGAVHIIAMYIAAFSIK